MLAFVCRRLLQAVVVMLTVAFIAFVLFQHVGDPVTSLLGQDATPAQREQYFAWFHTAEDFKGGNSMKKFILRIREEAVKKLTDAERAQFAAILESRPAPAAPAQPAVARAFQRNWTVADLAPDLAQAGKGRNFARGKEIFASTQCVRATTQREARLRCAARSGSD